jgi:hypothetical protein
VIFWRPMTSWTVRSHPFYNSLNAAEVERSRQRYGRLARLTARPLMQFSEYLTES